MKETIQAFLDEKKLAVAGASNNKENFGRYLVKELIKSGYEVYPVNPKCKEIEGNPCVATVKELPQDVRSLILAVPSGLTDEIIAQTTGTPIKRVWMIKGAGAGAYSEKAHQVCRENDIDVVYGFCPMMYFGRGIHKFHLWLRKSMGKTPSEFRVSKN